MSETKDCSNGACVINFKQTETTCGGCHIKADERAEAARAMFAALCKEDESHD